MHAAFFSREVEQEQTVWHGVCGGFPLKVLRMIHALVVATPLPIQAKRDRSYHLQLVEQHKRNDALKTRITELEVIVDIAGREPDRLARRLEEARTIAVSREKSYKESLEELVKEHKHEMKVRKQAVNARITDLKHMAQRLSLDKDAKVTGMEVLNTKLETALRHAAAAARSTSQKSAAVQFELEESLQRAREGRVWERVRAAEAKAEAKSVLSKALKAECTRIGAELAAREQDRASKDQELYYLRHRVKELQEKNNSYQVRSNRKFYEVEPIQEENEHLREKLSTQAAESEEQLEQQGAKHQRDLFEQTELARAFKAIAEPTKKRFLTSGHCSAEVDLAIMRCLQAGVSRTKLCRSSSPSSRGCTA